jgi:hypothetical protein
MAQETNVTIPRPPGSHPKKARERFTNLWGVLLSANRYPANVKSGIAINIG